MLDNPPSELQTLHCWKTLFHWVLRMPPLWGTPNHSSPRHTLHAMPLAQAVTTVVAQPRANACKLHCVEHFYSTTQSLTNVMAHMLHIALFKESSMSICYTGSNMLVCALSFDSQLSCVFYLLNVSPIFSNVFPSSFADSINNFPSPSGPHRKNDTLNQYIDDAREQTNLRPG